MEWGEDNMIEETIEEELTEEEKNIEYISKMELYDNGIYDFFTDEISKSKENEQLALNIIDDD